MSTHNIQFHDKIRKKNLNISFLSYCRDFVGTEKIVRIIQGKLAIRVQATEVILYLRHCEHVFFFVFFFIVCVSSLLLFVSQEGYAS